MSFLRKLVKRLDKMFDGQVAAHEESGCLVLSGQLQRWSDIVLAGIIAADKNPYIGLVNDIECTGGKPTPMRKPNLEDSALEWEEPDILIIGGGIIGCAIARELSEYELDILLVEKEHDVAMQASGRNTGVVHSGVGLKKGTQKHIYTKLGNAMFEDICTQLGVGFHRCGQLFYYTKRIWDAFLFFPWLYWIWHGAKGVRVVKRDELQQLEPAINPDIGAALFCPSDGVVCPFDLTIAYAENAVQNGVAISFNTLVQEIVTEDGMIKSVVTNRGTIRPKVVINAAGVFSDDIATLSGDRFFSIHPQKGSVAVLDKKYASKLVQTAVSTLGKRSAKKRHMRNSAVVRSIRSNVLVGPDTLETMHKEDYSTVLHNVDEIISDQAQAIPALDRKQILTYYSGINAVTYNDDFIVRKGRHVSNIIHAAGIQSPGLAAAPAIGVAVKKMALEFFGGDSSVKAKADFNPNRTAPPLLAVMDDDTRTSIIETNPDYGIIVCRCEEISRGEILHALRRNVRCDSTDGVKRRVRSGMGRCQGGLCTPHVHDILTEEKRLSHHNVKKSGSRSEVLYGNTKALLQKKFDAINEVREIKTDPETQERLSARAKEMLASSLNKRKDE